MTNLTPFNWQLELDAALAEQKSKRPLVVDLLIVRRDKMQRLNLEYRKKNTPTDVLSFPLYSFIELNEIHNTKYRIHDTPLLLGSLVICPSIVRERAKEEGAEFSERAAWTVCHGLKHLLGYDHDESGENWHPIT